MFSYENLIVLSLKIIIFMSINIIPMQKKRFRFHKCLTMTSV